MAAAEEEVPFVLAVRAVSWLEGREAREGAYWAVVGLVGIGRLRETIGIGIGAVIEMSVRALEGLECITEQRCCIQLLTTSTPPAHQPASTRSLTSSGVRLHVHIEHDNKHGVPGRHAPAVTSPDARAA